MNAQLSERQELAVEVLRLAKDRLLVSSPFLAPAASLLPFVPSPDALSPLSGTDAKAFYFNADHVLACFAATREAPVHDYVHTLLHCLFLHPFANPGQNQARWDLACDIAAECIAAELCGPEPPPISWTWEIGGPFMSGNARYDVSMRLRAVELYEQGCGRDKIASLLGMSLGTVREWLAVYRSVGIEVLAMTGGKHATYSFETKLAAVRAVVDEGMTKPAAMARFGITSTTSLKTWLRAYREGGPDALRPKPKGRHKGTSSPPKKTTREQELERRIRKLEAENAYLKKSIALKAEKRSRTAIRRSS